MDVAALFVLPDSIYKTIPGVDCYDAARDARRTFPGGLPVVAHPPCRQWGRLRHMALTDRREKELATWTVDVIRKEGGLLEHPAWSKLWEVLELPRPDGAPDAFGGYTLAVDQWRWDHPCRKPTWFYICGVEPGACPELPPLRSGRPLWVITDGPRRPDWQRVIPHSQRSVTPPDLAKWMVTAARCASAPILSAWGAGRRISEPDKSCTWCATPLSRRRFGRRLECLRIFRARRFCDRTCSMSARNANQTPSMSLKGAL